ncbi:hypothetical protein HKM21_27625 [Longimicrobium terrae]|nr:hypothetical protein [Longimicrobium terrae]
MQLGKDFVFNPEIQTPPDAGLKAAAAPVAEGAESGLGLLGQLHGHWKGTGFNTIWRPFFGVPGQGHFLELNRTTETLTVEKIHGAIPNRGLLQKDIDMFGVHYLQKVKDANTLEALHFEPGIWLNIPETSNPLEPPTVARLASIPHGTTVLAQGTARHTPGGPTFDPVDITPFLIGHPTELRPFPESNLAVTTKFRSPVLTGITQSMVDNANSVLASDNAGKKITGTSTFRITSDPQPVAGGGTANTAFLQGLPGGAPNADAVKTSAIFWINEVSDGTGTHLELQYTQTVLLDFGGLSWPHVSVATLRKVKSPTPD